jgi:hypothetical protein
VSRRPVHNISGTCSVSLVSTGGASLRTHWNAGEALKQIQDGRYDRVVLQEQSTLPVKNAKRMHENVRRFAEAIQTAGAKTVLYMTWARRNAPESQQAITDAYTVIGRDLGAMVVPADPEPGPLCASVPSTCARKPKGPARFGPTRRSKLGRSGRKRPRLHPIIVSLTRPHRVTC